MNLQLNGCPNLSYDIVIVLTLNVSIAVIKITKRFIKNRTNDHTPFTSHWFAVKKETKDIIREKESENKEEVRRQ